MDEAHRLLRQGALDAAAQRCTDVLHRDPANADALYLLAQIACRQGRIDDGIALVRRSLAADPRQAHAHNLLGLALSRTGRPDEAVASFDAAIAADPALADAHGHRGDVLAEIGRKHEAVESYDRAVALAPDSFPNWCNRGAVLYELQRFDQAVTSFDRALALKPHDAQVHFNRGNALAGLARHDDALAAFEAALAIAPNAIEALHNRGCLLLTRGRFSEAVAAFERLLTLDPQHPAAIGDLAFCHLMTCDWDSLARSAPRLAAAMTNPRTVIPPFTLLGLHVEPQLLRQNNARFVAQQVGHPEPFVHQRPATSAHKLRIAYLGDFNRHPVSYLTAGLFERHDRARFDLVGVAFGRDDDSAVRACIAQGFDHFLDAASLPDEAVARWLAERNVHIAVDLVGHTENLRPGVLARRPAPIQVSYLGYLATMAADFIDYVIGDAVVLPFEQQPFYSERIVQLPDCFMVHDRSEPPPHMVTRADAGLPADGFVFCSFNHSYKITAPVFDAWMRLLRNVDGSVLWLLAANPQAVANLRREAAKRAVDPQRLVFAGRVDLAAHLDRQRLADLFLDTLPYNAGATASAALWAGVPIVTGLGTSLVGRMAASMLHAIGLPELVTANLAEYAALAQALAQDPARLRALKERLAQNRRTHPLFDTARSARHLETAYATMWQRWQKGEAPQPFRVPRLA